MIDYYEPNIDLTLLGCGFLGTFHIGAITLLRQIWPHKPYNRICGASCGGLLGALLVSEVEVHVVLKYALDIIRQLRRFLLKPNRFISIRELVDQSLEALLPADAHELCSGKLGVSLTKIWSMQNVFVSEFKSRRELIDAVAAGCFIPFWSGSITFSRFKHEPYVDGAYSDNSPKFLLSPEEQIDGRYQIEVCPFAGEIQVSPMDKNSRTLCKIRVLGSLYNLSWSNIWRFRDAMIPMSTKSYVGYLLEGHQQMKDYVLDNDMVKCLTCYQLQEVRKKPNINGEDKSEQLEAPLQSKPCLFCLKLREQVESLRVPQELIKLFHD